jgi:cytochrome c-type biogenesis protein CcmH
MSSPGATQVSRRLVVLLAALVLAPVAVASEQAPTLAELEKEVVCPTCHTTLELSSSLIADRMRAFIRERIAAGDTKSEIKARLVDEFGEGVLAAPPRRGFNLIAWLLPAAGAAAAGVLLALAARRWARGRTVREPMVAAPLAPEVERRVDEALARFDA